MPWRDVTVSEQRQRFIEDYLLNYYSVTELAGRVSANIERRPHLGLLSFGPLGERPTLSDEPSRDFS